MNADHPDHNGVEGKNVKTSLCPMPLHPPTTSEDPKLGERQQELDFADDLTEQSLLNRPSLVVLLPSV